MPISTKMLTLFNLRKIALQCCVGFCRPTTWISHNYTYVFSLLRVFLVAQRVKRLPAMQETRVRSLGWEDPRRRQWQPTPELLPGKSHGQRSLVGYSPWDCKESDMTEQHHFPFLSPSWASFPSSHPTPLGHHRAPGWASSVTQQLPTNHLFYTWQCVCVNTGLSTHPTLPSPTASTGHSQRSSPVPLLEIPYMCVNTQHSFFSFSVHSIYTLYSPTSIELAQIHSFHGWVIFHCIYVPHLFLSMHL